MPIRVKCTCGKVLSVRDEFAGRSVKCPGCGKPIAVAAAGGAKAPAGGPKRPGATASASTAGRATPAAPQPAGELDDLFHEAGFALRTGKTCPNCYESLAPDAVLCTKCGFNLATGTKLQGHTREFVDPDSGEAYLQRAEIDMQRAQEMQRKMESGSGMPWWMLGFLLFVIGSATAVAVIAVNMSRREDSEMTFDALGTVIMLAGGAMWALSFGAFVVVVVRAFQESTKQGLLNLFVPFYMLYYACTRFSAVGKPFLLYFITGAIAGGLMSFAVARGTL